MTSSATQDFLSEIVSGEQIPEGKLAYFEARLCVLIHQAMLSAYSEAEGKKRLTKRELARRISRKPEQLTRWLSYPGNLTLETIGRVLIGMGLEIEGLTLVDHTSGARVEFPQRSELPDKSSATATADAATSEETTNVVELISRRGTPVRETKTTNTRYREIKSSRTKVKMYG